MNTHKPTSPHPLTSPPFSSTPLPSPHLQQGAPSSVPQLTGTAGLLVCLRKVQGGQRYILWVPFDGLHNDTDRPQGVQSAFLLKTSIEDLVLQCGVFSSCDGSLVTPTNNILVKEFLNDFLCFHCLYKLLLKLVQDFFSCMEGVESWYMHQATNSS